MTPRRAHIVGAALVILLFAGVGSQPPRAQPAQTTEGCVTCHAGLSDQLAVPARSFAGDVHESRGFGCVACHGGDPTASEAQRAKSPEAAYLGVPTGAEVVEVCANCHGDAELMRRFAPTQRIDQAAEYALSVHGERLAAGDTNVATCTSCHGAHGIRAVNDARSPVFPLNVADTCGACHADPTHMAAYAHDGMPFPTHQVADYEISVHFDALTAGNDLSAPTCNDCHGNHGAAPPGVGTVSNVCGTCHGTFAQRYEATTHAFVFERGCAECHGQHAVQVPDDAMLGPASSICMQCHSEGDTGLATASAMSAALEELKSTLAQTERLVTGARNAGMEMSVQEVALREAENHLTLARTAVHAFDAAAVAAVVEEGLAQLTAVEAAGQAAMVRLRNRRRGLVISLVAILLFVVALGLKIRELDRRSLGSHKR